MSRNGLSPIPLPASFSATIVRSDGDIMKVWVDSGKRRVELTQGGRLQSVAICLPAERVMYSLNLEDETCFEIPMSVAELESLNVSVEDDVVWRLVGGTQIDGEAFDEYESWSLNGDAEFPTQRVYVDPETRMRRRVVTIDKSGNAVITVDYQDVALGPQPPRVFEIPEGFQKQKL